MNLNQLAYDAHATAVEKQWYNPEPTFAGAITMCHCELSEAVELWRQGDYVDDLYYTVDKPDGIPIELADVIIRVLDICAHHGVDIDTAVRVKMEYNKTRPRRHGGKML